MRKKSYLSFKDLRAFYDKKTDTIRLTSGDPDLAAQGWSLTLNRETPAEQILRDELTEAGIITSEPTAPKPQGSSRAIPDDDIQKYVQLLVQTAASEHGTVRLQLSETGLTATLQKEGGAQETISTAGPLNGKEVLNRLRWLGNGSSPSHLVPTDSKFELGPYVSGGDFFQVRFMSMPTASGQYAMLRAVHLPGGLGFKRNDKMREADEALDLPLVVGDESGTYLGHTTGKIRQPVFFSPHDAIEKNNPPATLIVGSPGSGKSAATLSIVYQGLLRGVRTVYLDPYGDEGGVLAKLPGVDDATTLEVKDMPAGFLSPYGLSTNLIEQQDLAIAALVHLLGGEKEVRKEARLAIAQAAIEVSEKPEPSLHKVIEALQGTNAAHVAAELSMLARLPFARLMFEAPALMDRRGSLLTVFNLAQLRKPGKETPLAGYSNADRLAVVLMDLLAALAKEMTASANRDERKSTVIEGAWLLGLNNWGKQLLEEFARIGRSWNNALLLVDPEEYPQLAMYTSTRMVFRATTAQLALALRGLGLEDNTFNRNRLRNLATGECFFRLESQLPATVQVQLEASIKQAYESGYAGTQPAAASSEVSQDQLRSLIEAAERKQPQNALMTVKQHDGDVSYFKPVEVLVALQELQQRMSTREAVAKADGKDGFRDMLSAEEQVAALISVTVPGGIVAMVGVIRQFVGGNAGVDIMELVSALVHRGPKSLIVFS